MEAASHSVTVEDCKKISATAIDSVDGFSPSQITLSYSGGRIIIAGGGLKIVNFSKARGNFMDTGTINGVKYAAKGVNFKQKLFK
ncbi:MAG: hypothetical protein LUD27_09000 [Clostridia bacterium]|nr:hypothetical protein [Clostridia bacterium]